ncbi:MAG: efflux RND transporter permease subunit [Lentisphaeria bacterium]|nr:efflux RND transporter permease subunit [Lentisphaeria bacterium]
MNDVERQTGRPDDLAAKGVTETVIRFCLTNRVVVLLLVALAVLGGIVVAPFDWHIPWLPRHPVPVDAIPDLGENQQIVFTSWPGRSPRDVEDQIGYPLSVAMLAVPGARTVRSYSMFGFSSVYVIFAEKVDFDWARSRILEKLSSLPEGGLPEGVRPALGPDATALGQVYWYTLEGRDESGRPAGGWDLHELRAVQDWYVRYALLAADGISEVAGVGGFVQEYQVDVDPDALRAHGVRLEQVFAAVRMSNLDVGARTIEVNRVEYVVRGRGFIRDVGDISAAVVAVRDNVPITVGQVATVGLGPAPRRGALDKQGVEAVGGVAVVRYGGNPLRAIRNLKEKMREIAPGLPTKVLVDYGRVGRADVAAFAEEQGFRAYSEDVLDEAAWLDWLRRNPKAPRPPWLTVSKVTIVPFYDRTGLIHETLGTLRTALTQQVLITVLVILVLVMHLRSSLVISATLPLAVLLCFVGMKGFGVDANVVALSGIAIAIGTIVDMGIIICENILRHMDEAGPSAGRLGVIYEATREVGSAVLTAILTTVVGFLPVFTMVGAEGKLFRPLAFTKTLALLASVVVALTVTPAAAYLLFGSGVRSRRVRRLLVAGGLVLGAGLLWTAPWWLGVTVLAVAVWHVLRSRLPAAAMRWSMRSFHLAAALLVGLLLTAHWLPLGPGESFFKNALFVLGPIAGLLGSFVLFMLFYRRLLVWFLDHKALFLSIPAVAVGMGLAVWLGFGRLTAWLPEGIRRTGPMVTLAHAFPGLPKEFMPDLDEGSFLYMPTTMPHASIGEVLDVLHRQDMAFAAIPEVASAVGKLGRADTALDPAPVSMIETIITYHPEFLADADGRPLRFRCEDERVDLHRDIHGVPVPAPDGRPYRVRGAFAYAGGGLVPDARGRPFRLWRPPLDPALNEGRAAWHGIRSADDIWEEITRAGRIPGTTSAPRLQPIAARMVMLQSGMRAPMGVKVRGPDLDTIEGVVLEIEAILKEVPGVEASAVLADRIVGKPYVEIEIDRDAAARYGVHVREIQDVIEAAIGGKTLTWTVEGRERYPVRVRYQRERRDRIEAIGEVIVPAGGGQQIPLSQLAGIRTVRGPQMIKTEDTFLVGYVLFDKEAGAAEVDVVEACRRELERRLDEGAFVLPPGVSYAFAGSYENQVRAARTLRLVLPVALTVIFLVLYLQFRSLTTSLLVFTGVGVTWAGGFILLWLYRQPWFLDVTVLGVDLRRFFQVGPVNMSVAVWVGFLALFGIATDDGVVMATYLEQRFRSLHPSGVRAIREAVVDAAQRRLRPCVMTTATTLLALIPVLTATGRGSDIMVPMAIPSFGGMAIEGMTMFVVPVLYALANEARLRRRTVAEAEGTEKTAD